MASLIKGNRNRLCLSFYWQGKLYRPSVGKGVRATKENKRQYASLERRVEHAIKEGTFSFEEFFPGSMAAKELEATAAAEAAAAPDMRLRPVAQRWLSEQNYKSPKTLKGVQYQLDRFLDGTALGEMDVREIMRKDIQAQIDAMARRSDRPGQPARLIAMGVQRLRSIFALLLTDGVISRTPVAELRKPKNKAKKELYFIQPADQVKLSAAATNVQDSVIVEMGFALGPRPTESLQGIWWDDFKMSERRLRIRGTKTDHADRTITLPPKLWARVMAALNRLPVPIDRQGPIFKAERGGPINLHDWTERNWRPMFEAAGLPYQPPNVMRHSFAIDCLNDGFSLSEVAGWMGDKVSTVERYYATYVCKSARDEHEPERFTAVNAGTNNK